MARLRPAQERRIAQEVSSLERDTGFKLRVLAQNYPETPGATGRVARGRCRGRGSTDGAASTSSCQLNST